MLRINGSYPYSHLVGDRVKFSQTWCDQHLQAYVLIYCSREPATAPSAQGSCWLHAAKRYVYYWKACLLQA